MALKKIDNSFQKWSRILKGNETNSNVLIAAAKDTTCPEDVLLKIAESNDINVLFAICERETLPENVIRKLAVHEKDFLDCELASHKSLPSDLIIKFSEHRFFQVPQTIAARKDLSKELAIKFMKNSDRDLRYVLTLHTPFKDILETLKSDSDNEISLAANARLNNNSESYFKYHNLVSGKIPSIEFLRNDAPKGSFVGATLFSDGKWVSMSTYPGSGVSYSGDYDNAYIKGVFPVGQISKEGNLSYIGFDEYEKQDKKIKSVPYKIASCIEKDLNSNKAGILNHKCYIDFRDKPERLILLSSLPADHKYYYIKVESNLLFANDGHSQPKSVLSVYYGAERHAETIDLDFDCFSYQGKRDLYDFFMNKVKAELRYDANLKKICTDHNVKFLSRKEVDTLFPDTKSQNGFLSDIKNKTNLTF